MELVGMTEVRQGTTKTGENKGNQYMNVDLHFMGKSLNVHGNTVAKVNLNLLKVNNPPPFALGNIYAVDLSDRGYLNDIELLEEAPAQPPQK
jgi:hypothetical protein